MTETARRPLPPRFGAVFAVQVRTIALAAWREAAAIVALLAVVAIAAIAARVGASEEFEGQPGAMPFFVLFGILSPLVFWKGEKLNGPAYIWTLPVSRGRHALTKALAGWMWLMLSFAGFLAWTIAVTLLSGGTVDAETTRLMLPAGASDGSLPRGALEVVPWTTPWDWLVPFTSGTIAYLFATALLLGTKRPLRWGVGLLVTFIALGLLGGEGVLGAPVRAAFDGLRSGPVGLDWALTGGNGLSTEYLTAEGRTVVAWRGRQTADRWLLATAFWLGAGALALWAALRRVREG